MPKATSSAPRTRASRAASAPDTLSPQQELQPAANDGAGAPPDAARTAIATITANLSEFDKVEAGIVELEKTYKGVVYPVATPKGMREACEARATINKPIFATEHARKAAKAPVLELGRDIDARAKAIDTRLRALVNPIDGQIKAQEQVEANRKADLERRVQEVQNTPSTCIGKNAAQLQEVLDAINSLPLDTFAEYRERAAAAQESSRQQVSQLLAQAKLAEEAAALKKQQEQETARKAILQQRVDNIADPLHLPYRTSQRVQEAIDRLTAMAIGEDFEEFAPAAREKKVAVLQQLVNLRDEKKRAEDEAARQAAATAPAPAPTMESMAREASLEQDPELRDHLSPGQRQHGTVDGLPKGAARIYPDEPVPPSKYVAGGTLVSTRAVDHIPGAVPTTVRTVLNTRGPMGMDPSPQAVASLDDAQVFRQSDHDRVNDESAQRLHESFGQAVGAIEQVLDEDLAQPFVRASIGAITPPNADAVDAEVRKRPSDDELVHAVATHFDVPASLAAQWLNTFDIFNVTTTEAA